MDIGHILNKQKRLKRLHKDIAVTLEDFPGLSVIYNNEWPAELVGNFKLRDNDAVEQGNWDVRILIPSAYPYGFPILYETSGKVKPGPDAHIDEYGKACVELDIKEEAIAKKGITIYEFVSVYVFKYFCWNLLHEAGETEALQAWKHREEGRKQFFYEPLNSTDDVFVITCLDLIIRNNLPSRNDLCFCGKNKKYKNCHQTGIEYLKGYGKKLYKYKELFIPRKN